MDAVAFFGLAGTVLSAAVTYVVMDYRHNDSRQHAQDESLQSAARVLSAQKTLAGYTHYLTLLPLGKQTLMEHLSTLGTTVSRDQVEVETMRLGGLEAGQEAPAILSYTVDYPMGFKFKGDLLEVLGTTAGIEIHLPAPVLVDTPIVRPLAWRLPGGGMLDDEINALRAQQQRLTERAQTRGKALSNDAAVRALCERKLCAVLHTFLLSQPGVTQVPGIAVVYR